MNLTWHEAIEKAKRKTEEAAKTAANRKCYGEIVARIKFSPNGPGKVRAEIVETFSEE